MKKSGVSILEMQDVDTTSVGVYHKTFKLAFPTVESQIPLFEAYFKDTTRLRNNAYEKVKGINSIVDLINAEHFLGSRPLKEIVDGYVSDVRDVKLTSLQSPQNYGWKTAREYIEYAKQRSVQYSSDVDAFMKG